MNNNYSIPTYKYINRFLINTYCHLFASFSRITISWFLAGQNFQNDNASLFTHLSSAFSQFDSVFAGAPYSFIIIERALRNQNCYEKII